MSTRKLSPQQETVLRLAAVGTINRCVYRSNGDISMNALARLGFAEWVSSLGHEYGKAHWYVTDAGVEEGKKF